MARKQNSRELDEDDDSVELPLRRRRRPRWRRRLLAFVALVVGLVIAGPTIVAKTPLRNLLLSHAIPGGAAQLATTDGAFSWVGGQSLSGITLSDATGASVATIESATIDRSLVALAANSRHLGKIVITRPVIHLETREGGSNLEDFLALLAEATAHAQQSTAGVELSTPTLAEIEVVEATVLGRDAATGQLWRIDGLTMSAHPNVDGAWEASGAGLLSLADPNEARPVVSNSSEASPAAGRFKFQLRGAAAGASQLDLIADRLPLAPLEPWLARVIPGSRLLGTTSADVKLTWMPPATPPPSSDLQPSASSLQRWTFSAAGKLDAADVRFTSAALAGDLVELRTASLAVDASLAGTRVSARQFQLESDWLDAEATGELDLAQLTMLSTERLPTSDAALTARVDLPQVTRMLPRTMRLRPGVRIDAGSLEVKARSTRQEAGRRWSLAAAVENLVGTDGKRPIRWTQPVEAGIDLAEGPVGAQLKRVIVRSPFASIAADGADSGIEGELEFNLDELAAQLGQFVDLSAWQLRGTGKGTFSWRETASDKFAASAGLDLKQIDVRRDGKIVWVDPELRVEFQSSGQRLIDRPIRFEAATALMRGPRDTLEVELLEPVDVAEASHDWFVRIKGDGPLDSWAGRLRPWVAAVPDELAGQSTVNARLRLSGSLVEVTQSQLSIRDFRTRLRGAELVESRIEAGGDFRWDAARRSIESQDMQLASSTVAARARGLDIRLADVGPPTVRGDIAFRGDLERIAAWAGLVGVPNGLWPRGQGVGRMQLASDAERASANLTLSAEPFTLVRSPSATPVHTVSNSPGADPTIAWNEPSLQLATEIAYTHADDRLQLANLRLDGQTVKLTGAGVIDQLRTAGLLRGDVTITYDSDELAKLLTAYLGPGIRFQAAAPVRLTATGGLASGVPTPSSELRPAASGLPPVPPHWSRRWQLTAETGWAAANLYGLPIGPAVVVANIRDGQIQFNPLDLAVGQGRLITQPRVLLDPPPQQLQLAAGPLASNIAVSAEVSNAMLKYAAPILADATRVSGTFSLITDGVQMPLGEPKLMRANGRLTMHKLSILPGPGLQDLVTIIQRLEQLSRGRDNLLGALAQPPKPIHGITMNERTIDVQVVDGRVYHRNLEFLIDDVPVTSYGSVGFDQTIALVIRVPIQAKWVGKEPALQRLIGQVIEIPVSGTFTQWKVDERAVGNFVAQAAQTAVGGAIEGEINKAFEGLFKRK